MIQNSAMLVELNISMWTGRKLDKQVSEEIDTAKKTKVRGGNYNKKLFPDAKPLERVTSLASSLRTWHYEQTLAWSSSTQLLPVVRFLDYKAELSRRISEIEDAIKVFLAAYPTLVTAAAFQLGELFDAEDYPPVDAVEKKFRIHYAFLPVPTSGDFRVDAPTAAMQAAMQEVTAQCEGHIERRVQSAMKEAWDRLHACVSHLSERLADSEQDGGRKRIHDSLLVNANELCGLLTALNVTNDPQLERARMALECAINGTTGDDLRESDALRKQTKAKVDAILDMF